jgi:phenylalanyl-tRNA synthetase beta chain
VQLPLWDVTRLLGERFTADSCAGLLRRLHLDVTVTGDVLEVRVPTYRPDLTIPADLIEEIARLADFDTFDETVPTGPAGGLLIEQRRARDLRRLLQGQGLMQAINLPFVSEEELAAFSDDGAVSGVVTVRNPLREDQSKLRQSLLPGLLRRLRENRNRGAPVVALFETGRVFYSRPWAEDARVPDQPLRLGMAVVGPFGRINLGSTPDEADATAALGIVRAIEQGLGVRIERSADTAAGFHPTRTAGLTVDGIKVGYAGELHPDVADLAEIDARVAILEMELAPLTAPRDSVQMTPVSTFPHVDFDLSFEVAMDAAAGPIASATGAVSELVERAMIFDDYRDPTRGLRAVAVRYRLRAPDRTLQSDEIAAVRNQMIEAAAALGATLRGAAG